MTFSSAKGKCRESTEEEKLNACTWEKFTISPTAAQQTVNVYGKLQLGVGEGQVKPVTVSWVNPGRREKKEKVREEDRK